MNKIDVLDVIEKDIMLVIVMLKRIYTVNIYVILANLMMRILGNVVIVENNLKQKKAPICILDFIVKNVRDLREICSSLWIKIWELWILYIVANQEMSGKSRNE